MIKSKLVKYKSKITENSNSIVKAFEDLEDAAKRRNLTMCQALIEKISTLETSNRQCKMIIEELLKLGEEE